MGASIRWSWRFLQVERLAVKFHPFHEAGLVMSLLSEVLNVTATLPCKRNNLRWRGEEKDGERMRMMEIGFCPYKIRA